MKKAAVLLAFLIIITAIAGCNTGNQLSKTDVPGDLALSPITGGESEKNPSTSDMPKKQYTAAWNAIGDLSNTPNYVSPSLRVKLKQDLPGISAEPKWAAYPSYEALVNNVPFSLMVPGNLPLDLVFKQTQYRKSTNEVMAVYAGEQRELGFLQKVAARSTGSSWSTCR